MSVRSEEIHKPEVHVSEDMALTKMFAALNTEEWCKDEWKITWFDTTPPVRQCMYVCLEARLTALDIDLPRSICQWGFCSSGELVYESADKQSSTTLCIW